MKPIAPAPTGPPVDLESYYYGTIEGDIGVLMTEFKADMAFKCHLCKKVFMNNIEFLPCLHHDDHDYVSTDLLNFLYHIFSPSTYYAKTDECQYIKFRKDYCAQRWQKGRNPFTAKINLHDYETGFSFTFQTRHG